MKICILVDDNNIVKNCGVCLSDEHIPYSEGITIETDLDSIDLTGNYKLVDGELVELTDDEKEELILIPAPSKQELLNAQLLIENADIKVQLIAQQELTSTLMLQIAELKGGNTNV